LFVFTQGLYPIVVYVDNCLLFTKDSAFIDSIIADLSKSFLLQDEGDVNAFLGVQIHKDPVTKTITFTQPNLIQKILRDVGISSSSTTKETPANSILYADSANHTRPDISMVVHQCARFCSNPKAIHELAVKHIAHYLLKTQTQGKVLHPTTNLSLNMFVDAAFAGRWHREYSNLRDSVLSCTGYVITFCGCPVIWASKLQSEITLSTTESKYIALSTATRDLLPLHRILLDIERLSFITLSSSNTVDQIAAPSLPPSKVFKDKNA